MASMASANAPAKAQEAGEAAAVISDVQLYVGNLPVYTNLASTDHLLGSWGLPRPLSGKIVGRHGQVVPGQEYSV